jgi:hypothetical protein
VVLVINRGPARRFFPNENPIGKQLRCEFWEKLWVNGAEDRLARS